MDFRPEMEEVEIVVGADDDMKAPETTSENLEVDQSVKTIPFHCSNKAERYIGSLEQKLKIFRN